MGGEGRPANPPRLSPYPRAFESWTPPFPEREGGTGGLGLAGRGDGSMTHSQWLACTDPDAMLRFLSGWVSERKLRLFAVACCRRLSTLVTDERYWHLLRIAEAYADGRGCLADLAEAHAVADQIERSGFLGYRGERPVLVPQAARSALYFATAKPVDARLVAAQAAAAWDSLLPLPAGASEPESVLAPRERIQQAALLRELCNPFLPSAVVVESRSVNAIDLARAIYDEQAFDRMPILSDALLDAGCEYPDVIDHCRGPHPHLRGCWLLDLILGKS